MRNWLYLTGHAASGAIWRIHKTLERLDRDRVVLNGIAGEVGRAWCWKPEDHEDTVLSSRDLIARAELPEHPEILLEMEAWLAELHGYSAFNIMDRFLIEHRLGCWAAPVYYANTTSVCDFSPFNSRTVFANMMKLPPEYRRRQMLSVDICRTLWPELLELPFNESTGIRRSIELVREYARRAFAPIRTILSRVVAPIRGGR